MPRQYIDRKPRRGPKRAALYREFNDLAAKADDRAKCEGGWKVCFTARTDADAAAMRMCGGAWWQSYQCRTCGAWHWSREKSRDWRAMIGLIAYWAHATGLDPIMLCTEESEEPLRF